MLQVIEVEFATPEYDDTLRLRDKILRKPLGLEFTIDQLAKEYKDTHLACYDQRYNLLGCLVLVKIDDKRLKMRQVAVDVLQQKRGVGTALVNASEQFARSHGYEIMELNARDTAIPFYLKLDYQKVGEPFVEVTVQHYKMEKHL